MRNGADRYVFVVAPALNESNTNPTTGLRGGAVSSAENGVLIFTNARIDCPKISMRRLATEPKTSFR
jgi:hypothetical protein